MKAKQIEKKLRHILTRNGEAEAMKYADKHSALAVLRKVKEGRGL